LDPEGSTSEQFSGSTVERTAVARAPARQNVGEIAWNLVWLACKPIAGVLGKRGVNG